MITAIVLLHCDVHAIPETAQAVADLDAVSEVYSVTGEWELVALVRVPTHEQIADVVTGGIAKIAGVTGTHTMVAFRAYSSHDLSACGASASRPTRASRPRVRVPGGPSKSMPCSDASSSKRCGSAVTACAKRSNLRSTWSASAPGCRAPPGRCGTPRGARANSPGPPGPSGTARPGDGFVDDVRDALYASKVVAYARGFEQIATAADTYHWDIDLGAMATIWRGGCIIWAKLHGDP